MQPDDVDVIAEVVVDTVKMTVDPLAARLFAAVAAIEARPVVEAVTVCGPPGEKGEPGPPGPGVPETILEEFRAQLAHVDARVPDLIPPEELPAAFELEFRKELALGTPIGPRIQKRIERDAQGRMVRVVEEPIA